MTKRVERPLNTLINTYNVHSELKIKKANASPSNIKIKLDTPLIQKINKSPLTINKPPHLQMKNKVIVKLVSNIEKSKNIRMFNENKTKTKYEK